MRISKKAVFSATRLSVVNFLMIVFGFLNMTSVQAQQLTYGSTIRLRHSATGRYVTGLNQKYNNPGSSGQWAIACTTQSDQNTHWVVEGGVDAANVARAVVSGQKVNAGDIVSFRNIGLNYRLHSHAIVSPASRQGEVSGFELGWGPNKQGDQNDNFQFVANPMSGSAVSIKHIGTGHYLHSHDVYKYGGKLCIFDNDAYQEVTTFDGVDANNDWIIEVVGTVPSQVSTEIDAARKKVSELEAALKIVQDEKARLEIEKEAAQNVAIQAQSALIQVQQASLGAVPSGTGTEPVAPVVTSSVVEPVLAGTVGGVDPVVEVAQSETVETEGVTSATSTIVEPSKAANKKVAAGKKAAKSVKKPAGKKAAGKKAAGKKAAGKKAAKVNKGATKKKQAVQVAPTIVSPN